MLVCGVIRVFEVCVPPEKLFDVAAIFTIVGFVVGWLVGIVSAFITIKRNPLILSKLMG